MAGNIASAGFTAAYDPTVTAADSSGVVILTNNGGVPFLFSGGPEDLVTLTYGTQYNQRPFVAAYVETDLTNVGLISVGYVLTPKNGGTTASCTLQAVVIGSGLVQVGGIIKIAYRVQAGVAG